MESGQTRRMTFGRALRGGADVFAKRWAVLLGTYFAGMLLQVAVTVIGLGLVASVVATSGGIAGAVLVGLLMAAALVVVIGGEYLIVCRLALDAHDGTETSFGEVLKTSMSRLGAFVLRVAILTGFLFGLRLAAGLVLFPLMGASPQAALVVAILFLLFTLLVFVVTLAFLPFAVLEKLKEPLRSSLSIASERAFTVLPVLLCMGGALVLISLAGIGAEQGGLGIPGQLAVVAVQGIVYVFGYCVLAVVFRSSSLGERSRPAAAFAIPPVPGALERFSITPGDAAARFRGGSPPPPAPPAQPGNPGWEQVQVARPGWGQPPPAPAAPAQPLPAPPPPGPVGDPWAWMRNGSPGAQARDVRPEGEVAATDEPPPGGVT